MDRLDEIIQTRKDKVAKLREQGIDPYPSSTDRTHTNKDALENFDALTGQTITLAGRMMSQRDMGKLVFTHIEDSTARIQVLLKDGGSVPQPNNVSSLRGGLATKQSQGDTAGLLHSDQSIAVRNDNPQNDSLSRTLPFAGEENTLKFFQQFFDIGDFIEATGTLFTTKSGEKTLEAKSYKLLAKSLRPLPSEHFGIEDEETKLRKRYLDILFHPEVKGLFIKKNKFWQSFRNFLTDKGFLEVEMPVLEDATGGAEAEPFITHHNALDRDFYLRISLELPLKKMLVAGYEKVFEIGRIFRNEGISATHLQDYTQMEFYWAYASFDDLLKFWQEMYQYVISQTFRTLQIEAEGQVCDWSGQWERVNYTELFRAHTGIDLNTASDEDLRHYCDRHNIVYENFARRGRLIDQIFKKVRASLPTSKPIFLINQPLELEPLAKRVPGQPNLVQRAQIIAYGTELGKGFGELNDPLDQRERFAEQMKLREAGDREAQMIDESYLEAMEYGMPPCAGFGVSERLFAVLMNKSIRETVIFPPMREAK